MKEFFAWIMEATSRPIFNLWHVLVFMTSLQIYMSGQALAAFGFWLFGMVVSAIMGRAFA